MSKKITTVPALTLVLLSHFPVLMYGQDSDSDNEQYHGALQVTDYKGDADFGYKIVDQDTVLQGPFQLLRSNLQALLSKGDNFFSFNGAFENNVPTGPWQFKFGEFSAIEGTEVVDYRYRIKVNGTQHEASGAIFQGKPHGSWTQAVYRITDSKVTETIFKSTIAFEKGVPQKGFQIQNEEMTLMGRFLRGGLAHDVWELYSVQDPDAIESWHFLDGKLKKIVVQDDDGTARTLQAYADDINDFKEINLDDRYLKIVRLNQQLTTASDIKLRGGMNNLLTQNAVHYRKIDQILSALGESAFMPEFKVKAAHYPLDTKESKQLDAIKKDYETAASISNSLLESTQFNILKLSDEEVLFLLSAVAEIRDQYLSYIRQMIAYKEEGILDFVPRINLVTKLLSKTPTASINVTYEDSDSTRSRTFTGPKADTYNFKADGIEGLFQLTQYMLSSMNFIDAELGEKLKKKERQQELMVLEEDLIKAATQLNELVDSLESEVSGKPGKTLKSIKTAAKQELSKYSAMEDTAAKPDQAKYLTSCFGQMEGLSMTIAKLPARWEEIKKEYTDEVWNPFTATVMSEEVKKRITDVYSGVLIPHILGEVKNQLSCDNVQALGESLDNAYQRVLAMREEDTARLERKLKKEQNPQVIMELFNIERSSKKVEQ